MAIRFIMKRETLALLMFVLFAIVVSIIFYAPGVLPAIAQQFSHSAGLTEGGSSWG